MNELRTDRGQATVLTVVFLTVMLGMTALVLDVGSWFREQRDTQAAADASALAAAQALPNDTGRADGLAHEYLAKNRGGTATVTFSSKFADHDTVTVEVERQAPGFFSKLFGIAGVDVGAKATARAAGIEAARWVAPIVVHIDHPLLNCGSVNGRPVPCFGKPTTLQLINLHSPGGGDAAGSFGLINLDSSGGNIGADTLAKWVIQGFDKYMKIGTYNAAPSANFNNSQFLSALSIRKDDVLLFPIYETLMGSGSGAKYDVAGWVGFKVSSFEAKGDSSTVTGSFTEVIWEGIQANTGGGANYGVRTISLVE